MRSARSCDCPESPEAIRSGDVETYFQARRIKEIGDYCASDVVNAYRARLRYELFRGRLTTTEDEASENSLADFLKTRSITTMQRPGNLAAMHTSVVVVT